jgi:hypothetical protein
VMVERARPQVKPLLGALPPIPHVPHELIICEVCAGRQDVMRDCGSTAASFRIIAQSAPQGPSPPARNIRHIFGTKSSFPSHPG